MTFKICAQCNINSIDSNIKRKKYCESCVKSNRSMYKKKYDRSKRLVERWNRRKELDKNFKELNPTGELLIPVNFDNASKFSSSSYFQQLGKDWSSILKRYNKQQEVVEYLKNEYVKWHKVTEQQNPKEFYRYLNTTKNSFKSVITDDDLRSLIGAQKKRYSIEDYNREFYAVLNKFDSLPSSTEFRSSCRINLYSYSKKFGLKGDIYIQLLRYYSVSEDKIEELINKQLLIKSEMAKEQLTGQFKISEEDLISDFKNVFDSFINKYGIVPSVLDFDRLSKYGKNTISSRLNMRFLEIAEMLGYPVDSSGSSLEKVTLENIKLILQSEYKSQATFKWLKGNSGKSLLCDGYFTRYNLVVEVDGIQHFQPVEVFGGYEGFTATLERDQIKNTLIPQHNLTLLRIAYDEPYYDLDFLRFKLIEHGIIPPSHKVLNDSIQTIKNAS